MTTYIDRSNIMNLLKTLVLSLTFLAVSLVLSTSTVKAQTVLTFNGLEISQGHTELDETYGWACYGRTTGTMPGNFTMTLNYAPVKELPGGNTLGGGTWTLPIYAQSMTGVTYMGVLYGTVKGGTIQWDEHGYSGTMDAQLGIAGGTQALLGSKGWVDAKITINRNPVTLAKGPPSMSGTLTLYIW
jgi:hypothetical protein